MQLLEGSAIGLRAARHAFEAPRGETVVTLFPMVRIADTGFFEDAYRCAASHDVVLIEGTGSRLARWLALSNRAIGPGRFGLVAQPPTLEHDWGCAKPVRADLNADEFANEWNRVPAWLRLVTLCLSPLFAVYRRRHLSRERLVREGDVEDRRSPEEILRYSPGAEPLRRLLRRREQRLVKRLRAELDDADRHPERRIAIVYGARALRPVIAELTSRGFRPIGSTWHIAIALERT